LDAAVDPAINEFRAGVAELVDATDLNDLSALVETPDVELLKFGEPSNMGIPSQAWWRERAAWKV